MLPAPELIQPLNQSARQQGPCVLPTQGPLSGIGIKGYTAYSNTQENSMPRKGLLWLLVIVLCFLLVLPSLSLADSGTPPLYLHLGGNSFDPLAVKESTKKQSAKAEQDAALKQHGARLHGMSSRQEPAKALSSVSYYLIQFSGPILSSWRQAVKNTGAAILEYIPDFAYLVRATPKQFLALQDIPSVRWCGPWKSDYCISPSLPIAPKHPATSQADEGQVLPPLNNLTVVLFPGEDAQAFAKRVVALGGEVGRISSGKKRIIVRIRLPLAAIRPLSRTPGVWRIESTPKRRLMNNVSTDIMKARGVRNTYGLTGKGEIVGVLDSGLDTGDPATLHKDFLDAQGKSRVTMLGDDCKDTGGHGTHVAGSLIGNGKQSGSDPASHKYPETSFAGIAPEAHLVVQKDGMDEEDGGEQTWEEDEGDLAKLFTPAWEKGVRLHSNSWGDFTLSLYTVEAKNLDAFVWEHRSFLPVFSAGNSGVDHSRNGMVDLYSICNPATAKNCLTVGASEGKREEFSETYEQAWGNDFSENPLADDPISNHIAGMAAFSSRGPVLDGRYKPDIVAPGTNILSTRSSVAAAPDEPYNAYYCWACGTSMSTPLTAGAATLVRQYLREYRGLAHPSAALLKAIMLNGAKDIAPGQYGAGDTQEIPNGPGPNNVSGWGRVNVGNMVFPPSPKAVMYIDEGDSPFLSTGENTTIDFKVVNASIPLHINLVWSDAPGTEDSYGALVNDLDLSLKNPDGTVHYPDNAQLSPFLHLSLSGKSSEDLVNPGKIALRCTTDTFAQGTLESLTFYPVLLSEDPEAYEVSRYEISICKDTMGIPGEVIWSSSEWSYALSNMESTPQTIAIPTNISLPGSFFLVLTNYTPDIAGLLLGDDTQTTRLVEEEGKWTEEMQAPYVQLHVRKKPDVDNPGFDRVNNALGIEKSTPQIGDYELTVKGYNVPQPWDEKGEGDRAGQPYALVISGGLEAEQTIDIPVPAKGNNQGGRIVPNGRVLLLKDQDLVFQIIPEPGYEVKQLYANNKPIGAYTQIALSDILTKLEEDGGNTSRKSHSTASHRASKAWLAKGKSATKLSSLSATFAKTSSSSSGGSSGGCLLLPASQGDILLWLLPLLLLVLRLRRYKRA